VTRPPIDTDRVALAIGIPLAFGILFCGWYWHTEDPATGLLWGGVVFVGSLAIVLAVVTCTLGWRR
jgi:predicted outer membrane lipoprotein